MTNLPLSLLSGNQGERRRDDYRDPRDRSYDERPYDDNQGYGREPDRRYDSGARWDDRGRDYGGERDPPRFNVRPNAPSKLTAVVLNVCYATGL